MSAPAVASVVPAATEGKDKTSADYYFGQCRMPRIGGASTSAHIRLRQPPKRAGPDAREMVCARMTGIGEDLHAHAKHAMLSSQELTLPLCHILLRWCTADSYSHFGIHEEMLKDKVRTDAYMKSIVNNAHLFKGKTVLDVGCGTGILCMFAAKAGAKKVYGIECASIYDQACEIVKLNGFADTITLIRGKVEDITLPVDKVDIIISEWMGYFLLYESMLDTVIYARDKWLAPGGLLFPDKAQLFVCAVEDAQYRERKLDFWTNVYGFDMTCIRDLAQLEPLVDCCDAEQVMSDSAQLLEIDLYTTTKEQLDFQSAFEIKANRTDYAHALVCYFNVEFSKTHNKLKLPTGPKNKYTHWKQTLFYLDEPLIVNNGESIKGEFKVKRNAQNPRDLDIDIRVEFKGKDQTYSQDRPYRLR
jgi:cyclopropane fatty-acyl-phospholipid synthase-like methyltransferase